MNGTLEKETIETISKKASGFHDDISNIKDFDNILESFLHLKSTINLWSHNLQIMVEQLRKLSWTTLEDDETATALKELIFNAKAFTEDLRKRHEKLLPYKSSGLAIKEIDQFNTWINIHEEAIADINFTFFIAPRDKEFQVLNDELNTL